MGEGVKLYFFPLPVNKERENVSLQPPLLKMGSQLFKKITTGMKSVVRILPIEY